ncbi:MAG: hypothetical protein IKV21_00015 [Clostridia bacterium]|nr:hypothetical protein [Clostridia bacterium]
MKEKFIMMSDAFLLALYGMRIEGCSRLIMLLFRRKGLSFLCRRIDRHILRLRKDFMLLEKRHLSVICLDI